MESINNYLLIKRLGWQSHCSMSGFALIELMVVIVIIGILAAVMIPSYQNPNKRSPTQSILASADREIAKLDWQEMAYSAPEHMEIGSTSGVTVVLGGNKSLAELASLVEKAGQTGGLRVQVSNIMSAHLSGSGFEIIPVTVTPEEKQLVSSMQVTTWKWQVKAKDIGDQELYLSLNAGLTVDGKNTAISVKTFERKISVQVTSAAGRWAFMERYWAYIATLLTAIIIPLIVFLWKRLTKANADQAVNTPDHQE